LHSSEGYRVNLCDFARDAEVSQYQLLRQFKRRYGAPRTPSGASPPGNTRLVFADGYSNAKNVAETSQLPPSASSSIASESSCAPGCASAASSST
jgi:hypothetical protein